MPSPITQRRALEEQPQEQAEEADDEHGEVPGARPMMTRGMLVRVTHRHRPRPGAPLRAPRRQRTAER